MPSKTNTETTISARYDTTRQSSFYVFVFVFVGFRLCFNRGWRYLRLSVCCLVFPRLRAALEPAWALCGLAVFNDSSYEGWGDLSFSEIKVDKPSFLSPFKDPVAWSYGGRVRIAVGACLARAALAHYGLRELAAGHNIEMEKRHGRRGTDEEFNGRRFEAVAL